jgi:hypothetical protein
MIAEVMGGELELMDGLKLELELFHSYFDQMTRMQADAPSPGVDS